MATYGVTYGQRRTGSSRRGALADLMSGNTAMQPLSSVRPRPLAGANAFQPVSDVLNSAQVANRQRLAAVTTPPSATPAAPPTTPTVTQTAPAAPPATPTSSWGDTDPILAQIKAIGQMDIGDAQAGAGASARDAIVRIGGAKGFPTLASLFAGDPTNPILGALSDQQNEQAAEANPYSTLAQLGQAHTANQHNIDQATNASNTFYGSVHANALADELNSYLGRENTAGQQLSDLLQQANSGVLAAKQNAEAQLIAALPGAYQRAVDAASANGGDPTAPPPPDTTPPPTDAGGGYDQTGGNVFVEIDPATGQPTGRTSATKPRFGTWVT